MSVKISQIIPGTTVYYKISTVTHEAIVIRAPYYEPGHHHYHVDCEEGKTLDLAWIVSARGSKFLNIKNKLV